MRKYSEYSREVNGKFEFRKMNERIIPAIICKIDNRYQMQMRTILSLLTFINK